MTTPDPPPGRYQHYKGRFYEVLGVARHSETEEELVVYRPLYGAGGLWVRTSLDPRMQVAQILTQTRDGLLTGHGPNP